MLVVFVVAGGEVGGGVGGGDVGSDVYWYVFLKSEHWAIGL